MKKFIKLTAVFAALVMTTVFMGCGGSKLRFSKDKTVVEGVENEDSVTQVKIPAGVKEIGSSAFKYCEKLASVTIENGVRIIGLSAFESCESLTYVTIPRSIIEIGSYAFGGCDSLKSVTFQGTMAQWKAIDKGVYGVGDFAVQCTDGELESQEWR